MSLILKAKKKGLIFSPAVFYKASGGGGSAFTYQGTSYTAGGGVAGLTVTYTITTTAVAAGALVVAAVGVATLSGETITSVVYDPTGANVTLTQDAFHNSSHCVGVFSGVVSGTISAGNKNIVATFSASPNFHDVGASLWTMTGLSSNLARSGNGGANNTTLGVTASHYMVGCSIETGGPLDYGLSTEVPTTLRTATNFFSPEWNTIIATNAAFVAFPSRAGAAVGGDIVVASYH